MKKAGFIYLLVITTNNYGQVLKRDSLLSQLISSKEDTNKVNLLLSIGDSFENSSPDTARYYGKLALDLSKSLGFTKGIGKSYRRISFTFAVQSQYDSVLYFNKLGLELARLTKDTFSIGVSLFNIGIAYRFMADYENAVIYNLEGVKLLEGKGYTSIESSMYDGLQVLYMSLAQYDEAIVNGERAAAIGRTQKDKSPLAVALNNLSLSYMEADQLDKAKAVLGEAISISRAIENKSVEAAAYNNLAEIAIREGKSELLKVYAEKGLQLNRELSSLEGITNSTLGLAIHYLYEKDFVKASSHALSAMKVADENNFLIEKSQCYRILASIAFAQQNFIKGQQYLQHSQKLDGQIFNESLAEKESYLKVKYETEKKEAKINKLEAEKIMHQMAMRQRSLVNYLLVGATVAIFGVSLLIFGNYKQKQKLQQQRINELETEKKLMATEAVLKGEEQERTRLAKDLHDGLGGMLSGIKYSFNTMKGNLIMTPENQQAFERSMDMLDSSIKEMRRVAHNMMPESLVKFGLDTALRDFCNDIQKSGALQLSYQSIGMEGGTFDQTTAITLYRIVQELISNTLKHAAAKSAIVQVTRSNNQISVTVEDDGRGFDTLILKQSKGIGWSNIQHRVDFLKAKLDVSSEAGKGTSVHIELTI
jgi:two-component system, NarL family, sensor kinase